MRTQDHFYRHNGVYVPSVTKILDVIAKGEQFNNWLKNNGSESDKILREAGDFGTNVHNHLEAIGKGIKVNLDALKPKERRCVSAFIEWKEKNVKRFIETEGQLITPDYGGTLDAVVELVDGRIALLDYKTSSWIYDTYDLQCCAYVKGYELNKQTRIDTAFILRFEKKEDKKEDMQTREVKGIDELFELFECARKLWVWKHKAELDKVNKEALQ